MRINLWFQASPKAPTSLVGLWVDLLAKEFRVQPQNAYSWMSSEEGRQFVAQFLREKGWQVTTYTTPAILDDKVISYGFEVAEDCEHFIAWKLSEP